MTAHDMVRAFVESIYKEHGICILKIYVQWEDRTQISEEKMKVGEIDITSRSE